MGKGGMGKPAEDPDPEDEKKIIPLDEDDIALLKTYGLGPYSAAIKSLERRAMTKTEEMKKRMLLLLMLTMMAMYG